MATATTHSQPPPHVIRHLRDNADVFAEKVFGDVLWSKQREVLQSVSRHSRTAVKSAHGVGKSWLAAHAVIWFLATRRPAEVLTTAPTWRQVERILWKEIKLAWGRAVPDIQALGVCLTTELKFGNGHAAYGLSTDDPDRFQGIHSPHLMVIVDEAAGVASSIFDAMATLGTGGEYRELLIGNPTSTDGRFYAAFQNAEALGYNCISIRADETPNFTGEPVPHKVARNLVTPQWVAERAVEWGAESTLYRARVDAEFPDGNEDNILVPLSWVQAACNREPMGSDTQRQMGLDVARFGQDACSVAGRVGYNLCLLESLPGSTGTLEVAAWARNHALAFLKRHGGPVLVCVDEGYNPGIVDILMATPDDGIRYEPVSFGSTASDTEQHSNRRNEMLWGLRELFRSGNAEPDIAITATGPCVERLKAQVSSMRFGYDSRLRPKVESKDDMKKRGLPSPDEGDAVALAFAATSEPDMWL